MTFLTQRWTVKTFLTGLNATDEGGAGSEAHQRLAMEIGSAVAKMHDAEVVHGDLTTSNMMLRDGAEQRVVSGVFSASFPSALYDSLAQVIIDFGLASSQPLPEDKAVDLYVLERAMLSSHPKSQPLITAIMQAYEAASSPKKSAQTMERLAQVRMRGRKRTAFG